MKISERIFEIMEKRGMSQLEFSQKTGISQSTISDWKRKKTNPSADKIMAICDTLSVSPYELLQDTMKTNEEIGYIVVSENTEEFECVNMYKNLNKRDRDRVMGYLTALKK